MKDAAGKFVIGGSAAALLLSPCAAYAVEPPMEILFIPPLFGALVVTAAGWFCLGSLGDNTARSFSRMLLLALLWTPVPTIQIPVNTLPFLPSALYLWGFGEDRLTCVLAVSIVAILGAVLLVIRSARRRHAPGRGSPFVPGNDCRKEEGG